MPRSFSQAALNAMFQPETSEVWLLLLKIDFPLPSGSAIEYVVYNTQDITSNGQLYKAAMFGIALPSETGESPSTVRIIIDAVDQAFIALVESAVGKPEVTFSIVLASDPDTVEAGPMKFVLESALWSEQMIQGELRFEDTTSRQYPFHVYDPQTTPELF